MRPTTMPEPWATLAAAYGGVLALADHIGVERTTLVRWSKGGPMPPAMPALLAVLAHRADVPWFEEIDECPTCGAKL